MTARYDLCILGAGPAGLAAAARAHDLGLRTALIEPGRPGGVGVADGALSSKTLWHLSMDYARACRSDRGYDGRGLTVDWAEVVGQVVEVGDPRDPSVAHGEERAAGQHVALAAGRR